MRLHVTQKLTASTTKHGPNVFSPSSFSRLTNINKTSKDLGVWWFLGQTRRSISVLKHRFSDQDD